MTTIQMRDIDIVNHPIGPNIIFIEQDVLNSPLVQAVAKAHFPALHQLMREQKFTGKAGTHLILPIVYKDEIAHIVFVGMGKREKTGFIKIEQYRRGLGHAIRIAEHHRWHNLSIVIPPIDWFDVSVDQLGKETATILPMAVYCFDQFITDPLRKHTIATIAIIPQEHNKEEFKRGLEQGEIIAHAVNRCRHWIDLPPASLTPVELGTVARDIAQRYRMKYTVFGEKEVNEMGMGGLAAVSRGSERDCQFVIMEYDCGNKSAPTLGFVGKGITFDSGGLSIKPAESMETMKDDMSGAAAVIAAMEALAQLKPKVNIVTFAPLAENIPSDKATKPGDIATFYNGKTAEIKNTDAEGRLILADALSYAEKHYKLDCLVDLATLTGSCANALGPFYSGIMSTNDELVARLFTAAVASGDKLWRLPFSDDYRPAIKSLVADMQNIGSKRYMAGAITAGLFLSNFVEKTPWAHIDIAGTSFNVPDISYYRPDSATGVGVRLLVSLAMNW